MAAAEPMSADHQKPGQLVTLPAEVGRLIIMHLKDPKKDDEANKGLVKTLLNLREACKTTKQWIDEDLGVKEGRRLFSNAQVHVDISSKIRNDEVAVAGVTLKRFLECPPPRYITALRISGVSHNASRAPEEFKQFGDYWTTDINDPERHYLDSLELDVIPIQSTVVMKFLTGPNMALLRKFQFGIALGFYTTNKEKRLPHYQMKQLEELYVGSDFRCLSPEKLASIKKLSCSVTITGVPDLTQLVKARKDDPEFQLLLLNNCNMSFTNDSRALEQFLRAVNTSKSKIRVIEMVLDTYWQSFMNAEVEGWEDEEAEVLSEEKQMELWNGVEYLALDDISELQENPDREMLNLKKISFDHSLNNVYWDIPLNFFSRFRYPTVTSLTFNEMRCDEAILMTILNSLRLAFPNLTSLEISWTLKRGGRGFITQPPKRDAIIRDDHSFFQKLNYLNLKLDWWNREPIPVMNGFLQNSFKLQFIPLRQLNISASPTSDPRVQRCFEQLVNKDLLGAMMKKRIGKTLEKFVISPDVGNDAKPALEQLQKSVKDNYEKRLKSHGLCRGELI